MRNLVLAIQAHLRHSSLWYSEDWICEHHLNVDTDGADHVYGSEAAKHKQSLAIVCVLHDLDKSYPNVNDAGTPNEKMLRKDRSV